MKKFITIAVASIAVASVAESFSPQIGVTTLTLTSKNNIIPVQFESLVAGTADGKVTADALVCTNNIPLASHLYIYQNNAYTAWTLENSGWYPRDISSTEDDGVDKPGVPADGQVLSVGSAIWLSLNGPATGDVSFYGKVASSTNSTIVAGKCNLLANPTGGSVDIIAKLKGKSVAAGDVIRLVGSAEQISWSGKNNNWGKFDPNANNGVGGIATVNSLEVSPYQGFWYYSNGSGNITINW